MAIIEFPDELAPEQAVVAEEIRASRNGRLPDLFRIMLHSPEVARGWLGLGTAVRYHTSLDDGVREMLICYVAQSRNNAYENAMHGPIAEQAGVPAAALVDLRAWRTSSDLGDAHRVALTLAEFAIEGEQADQAALEAALEAFGSEGVLEIYALVGYYTAVSLFMNGMGMAAAPPK